MDLRSLAIQYHKNDEERRVAQLSSLDDVYRVEGFDEQNRIIARPLYPETATPTVLNAFAGLRCDIGDEIAVHRIWGEWWAIGRMSGSGSVPSLIHGAPIIVPPFIRDADAASSNTWGTPNAVVDFASLRSTITDLDSATSYLVEADAEAYLSAASSATKVALGVRIGFASDPDSVGLPQFGAGHHQTSPTLTRARFARVVSGVFSIEVTGRGYSSAVGSHTIGDGALYTRIVPLIMTGGI